MRLRATVRIFSESPNGFPLGRWVYGRFLLLGVNPRQGRLEISRVARVASEPSALRTKRSGRKRVLEIQSVTDTLKALRTTLDKGSRLPDCRGCMVKIEEQDFPFVEKLPKREKSKLARVWDDLKAFNALQKEHGLLLTPRFAGALLGVGKSRIDQLMDVGKLTRVEFQGHPYIPEPSVIELARSERKNGRPFKMPTTLKEKFKAGKEMGRR
jgi:hypothetical protein